MTAQNYYLHDFYVPTHAGMYSSQSSEGTTSNMPPAALTGSVSSPDLSGFAVSGTTFVTTPVQSTSTPIADPLSSPSATDFAIDYMSTNVQATAAATSTSSTRRERVQCPLCSSDFGRVPDLNRHLAYVHRSGSRGPLWACCGVPVDEARTRYGMSEEEMAASRRGQYNGRLMVGGCWSANFSRRDAYARHLRYQNCVGDPYGEYHLGNQ